jgi:hypothetical protein
MPVLKQSVTIPSLWYLDIPTLTNHGKSDKTWLLDPDPQPVAMAHLIELHRLLTYVVQHGSLPAEPRVSEVLGAKECPDCKHHALVHGESGCFKCPSNHILGCAMTPARIWDAYDKSL